MNILTLNAGSSSLKYKLFAMPAETVLAEDSLDHGVDGIASAAKTAVEIASKMGVDAVGHRVVQGGKYYSDPVRITPAVLDTLHSLKELDPLHNPIEIAMIASGLEMLPNVPAFAIFDTAFHKTMPEIAWRYALPTEVADNLNLRRYGFHGISYEYVCGQALHAMKIGTNESKLIICHLGNGASICALQDGLSIDTSMGITPLAGLIMGTRSGDVDPGLLLYLLRAKQISPDDLDTMLNDKSGLLGISETSSDIRDLEKSASLGDHRAELALEIFAYQVSKYIGAYIAALDGVHAVVFTGGIGEKSADIRKRVCSRLGFFGFNVDQEFNIAYKGSEPQRISAINSRYQIWVIPTNEELQIARTVFKISC